MPEKQKDESEGLESDPDLVPLGEVYAIPKPVHIPKIEPKPDLKIEDVKVEKGVGKVDTIPEPVQIPKEKPKEEPKVEDVKEVDTEKKLSSLLEERPKIDVKRVYILDAEPTICTGSEMFLTIYRGLIEKNQTKLMEYKDDIENCFLVGKIVEILCDGTPYEVGLRNGNDLELPRCEVTRDIEFKHVQMGRVGELLDESVETEKDETVMFTREEQENLRIKVNLTYLLPKKGERILYMQNPMSPDWMELEKERAQDKTKKVDQKIESTRRLKKSRDRRRRFEELK